MSTTVDQFSKVQQSQVGKNKSTGDTVYIKPDTDFSNYNNVSQQTFNTATPITAMSNQGPTDQTYMPNYYLPPSYFQGSIPTMSENNAGWPNTADPATMNYISGYPNQPEYISASNGGVYRNFNYQGLGWDYSGENYPYPNSTQHTNTTNSALKQSKAADPFLYSYYASNNIPPMHSEYTINGSSGTEFSNDGHSEFSDVNKIKQNMKNVNINDDNTDSGGSGDCNNGSKKSWATIASQPAKPGHINNNNNNINNTNRVKQQQGNKTTDFGSTWSENKTKSMLQQQQKMSGNLNEWSGNYSLHSKPNYKNVESSGQSSSNSDPSTSTEYNPKDLTLNVKGARFFIIKSYSEDDIHRSIKYKIWCSTEHGNKRLDAAFKEREGKGPLYLFFSVNGSGHFCGVAQMMSYLDYQATSSVWAQDKWRGQFEVKWIYVKDVPNSQLRHIRLENNENKPVTNSRDTQEVPSDKGRQVLRIIHQYRHTTSIFDDFSHYEQKQKDDDVRTDTKQESRDDREKSGRERKMNKKE